MSNSQAAKLGTIIARARQAKGLSFAQLSEQTGYATGWLLRLERGEYLEPAADRLTKLGELLDISPERLNQVSRGRVAGSLPGMQTYFRTKYSLTPEQADQVERYVGRLRRKETK